MGDDADNPIDRWQRDLTEAQSLMGSGCFAEAVTLLQTVLERTSGLSGDVVAAFKPQTLGSLGAAYFRVGDRARAIEFTQQALEMCRELGDEEGARIYNGNIQYIHNST
jgi:tetratricopeptide (TPR) repeat protein